MQMDRVEDAPGRTDSAADTLIRVYHRSSAGQATGGFHLYLFLGQTVGQIPEVSIFA